MQSKGLKGDEYKKFRDNCLKAKPEGTAAASDEKKLTPQQEDEKVQR
jgi:hypothetical protein